MISNSVQAKEFETEDNLVCVFCGQFQINNSQDLPLNKATYTLGHCSIQQEDFTKEYVDICSLKTFINTSHYQRTLVQTLRNSISSSICSSVQDHKLFELLFNDRLVAVNGTFNLGGKLSEDDFFTSMQ